MGAEKMDINQAIATHGAVTVYRATGLEPGVTDRMLALGLDAPRTMADVMRVNQAAYDALSNGERAAENREARAALRYLASACKAGVAPNRPFGMRWTA
jgi:hypothetical protein